MNWPCKLLSGGAALVLAAALVGCASVGAPLPPSLELPKPPGDLRAFRKGNTVTLTWDVPDRTIDRQTVRHRGPTLICRNLQVTMSDCGTPVGSVAPDVYLPSTDSKKRLEDTFVDELPWDLQQQNPTRSITYAVEALNESGRAAGLSNQVQVPLAPTLPAPMLQAQPTADGVVLTWPGELNAASNPDLTHSYRIYRRREGTIERVIIGDIARGPDVQPSLVDRTFAWETHYEYWLTVVTHVKPTGSNCGNTGSSPSQACREIEVEGENSATFKIFTRDVFPPAIPTGLQAVFSGPGQKPFIDLVWAPDTDADLAGYNAYRREENSTAVKLNSDLLKAPAFRDTNVVSGKTYWYSVSAVDARGNESSRSDEASETVP